jgi:aminobenzoyl-glutamate utilization protein B
MSDINANLINEVNSLESDVWDLAHKIWELSELSLEEQESSALEAQYLAKNGFVLSDHGIGGLDFAWIATWGSGKPVIGITVEFDALPGLGNEISSMKMPRKDGNLNGHGCGHNLIGNGAICAAVALKNHLEKNNINATLKVFGCPAEELITGKNFMARAGAFDDLDACLHWHPLNKTMAFNVNTASISNLRVEFFGRTSHSGLAPWAGRSAAHAAELFVHGINAMREHLIPEARVQYLVETSGSAVNVVSDYAKINIIYRGPNVENVMKQVTWINDIGKGASLITQTTNKVTDLAGCYDILPNQAMADRVMEYLNQRGAPQWTSEEQEFAKKMQKSEGYDEQGLSNVITPDPKGISVGGASDVGDISYITPTMGLAVACWPLGFAPHTWAATACNGMSIGKKGMMRAAEVLALVGLDLITDAEFLAAAKSEFLERTGGKPYQSLCKSDVPPLSAEHLHHIETHDAIHHL